MEIYHADLLTTSVYSCGIHKQYYLVFAVFTLVFDCGALYILYTLHDFHCIEILLYTSIFGYFVYYSYTTTEMNKTISVN